VDDEKNAKHRPRLIFLAYRPQKEELLSGSIPSIMGTFTPPAEYRALNEKGRTAGNPNIRFFQVPDSDTPDRSAD